MLLVVIVFLHLPNLLVKWSVLLGPIALSLILYVMPEKTSE